MYRRRRCHSIGLRAPVGFDNRLGWQKSRRRPDSQGGISMRRDIEFKTEDGLTLRGWHYVPDGSSGRVPTIVMAHGFSAVKEMFLDKFAEEFASHGLAALVFDNRNF